MDIQTLYEETKGGVVSIIEKRDGRVYKKDYSITCVESEITSQAIDTSITQVVKTHEDLTAIKSEVQVKEAEVEVERKQEEERLEAERLVKEEEARLEQEKRDEEARIEHEKMLEDTKEEWYNKDVIINETPMEYVKQQIEGSEDFNVIRIEESELSHYLENGYVQATKEEYEANGGEVVAEEVEAPVEVVETPVEEVAVEEVVETPAEEVTE